MIFGNETPFHLKPLPYRGLRQVEAEVVQHYPRYRHPGLPPVSQQECTAFMNSEHRLHPQLTVNDELKHQRQTERAHRERVIDTRRQRNACRDNAEQRRRDDEFASNQLRSSRLAGTGIKNMGSEDRDVLTHQCRTVEAQEKKDYNEAMGRYRYHNRQRVIDHRLNPAGYNIISWEPRPEIAVPQRPTLPPSMRQE